MRRTDSARGKNPARLVASKAKEVLMPIIAFLRRSGMTQRELQLECRRAIHRASASKLKVAHIAFGQDSTNIVNRWLRDPAYLNAAGRPADLPLSGNRSIASLLKTCQVSLAPSKAVAMLVEFGVAKKVAARNYRLVRRLMDFGHSEYLPFEPNFRFLADATRVSTNRLRNARKAPGLFWHCAYSLRIDSRNTQEFLRFAKQRSLLFMHEINDWLDEHESSEPTNKRRPTRMRRLGVGLFGISSDH
jgi:hypothetical protein